MRALLRLAVWLAVAAGCAAPTLSFKAEPRFLCARPAQPGALRTTLSWQTNAEATLAPARPEVGVVSGKGQATVAVDQTTDFVMTARKSGKIVTGTQRVTVLAHDQERLQLDPKSCDSGGGVAAVAVFATELPAANWPADITTASVALSSAPSGQVQLEHGGARAVVEPGQTAAPGLEKTSLGGPWRATLKLADCASAPDTLIVIVKIACSGG